MIQRSVLAVLAAAASLAACGDDPTASGPEEVRDPTVTAVVVRGDSARHAAYAQARIPLQAAAYNRWGERLHGKVFTWSSSDTAVASVDPEGVVAARLPGSAVITAREVGSGVAGSFELTLTPEPVRSVWLFPDTARVAVGAPLQLTAEVTGRYGRLIPYVRPTWQSLEPDIASVSSVGVVTGVAPGVARIVASAEGRSDTVAVASLGPQSLFSSVWYNGRADEYVFPNLQDTIHLPVRLDLSRVSAQGSLGQVDLEVTYDTAVFQFATGVPGVTGTSTFFDAAGRLRYTLSSTTPQGSGVVTLFVLVLRVKKDAPERPTWLGLSYRSAPRGIDSTSFSTPVSVGSRLQIANWW